MPSVCPRGWRSSKRLSHRRAHFRHTLRDEWLTASAQTEAERVIGTKRAVEGDARHKCRIHRVIVVCQQCGQRCGGKAAEILCRIADCHVPPVDDATESARLRVQQDVLTAQVLMQQYWREPVVRGIVQIRREERFRVFPLRRRHARKSGRISARNMAYRPRQVSVV